jgi:hypothetical protein
MYSNLIAKACNLVVDFYLRDGHRRLAGKIIGCDEVFVEVRVRINKATGEFAQTKAEFASAGPDFSEDRILININDISLIA